MSKRTFGLVGDYGDSDSESESEVDAPTSDKKSKSEENLEIKDNFETEENEGSVELKNVDNAPPVNSKWAGVRQEYENSSLMYKFVSEEEERTADTPAVADDKSLDGEQDIEINKTNSDSEKREIKTDKPSNESPKQQSKELDNYYKTSFEASLQQINEQRRREQMALEWEIAQIKGEISSERKTWEALYSDDEEEAAGGAETKAVLTDLKRRQGNVKKVLEEVTGRKVGEDGELEPRIHNKGERWKRLQMMHETKMKNNQEHYGSYPNHMFPLRD